MPETQLRCLYPELGKAFFPSCPYRSAEFGGGVDAAALETIYL